MPFQSHTYNVLIASPSDLGEERQAAKQAIHEWNDLNAEAEGITLLPVMWETHATPEAGDRPQAIINKQLVAKSDLLIGLFGTKLGTNTGVAESGTVEEINQIVGAGKPAMLYFSKRPIDPSTIDLKQLDRLKAFQTETYANALVNTFTSPDDLRQMLVRHLTRRVRMIKAAGDAEGAKFQAESKAGAVRRSVAEDKRREFETSVEEGRYHLLSRDGGYLMLSIVPLQPPDPLLDIMTIQQRRDSHDVKPMGVSGWNTDTYGRSFIQHDGSVRNGAREAPKRTSELRDDGCIFAVVDLGYSLTSNESKKLPFQGYETMLLEGMTRYIGTLRRIKVSGPLLVGFTLRSNGHIRLVTNDHSGHPLRDTSRALPQKDYRFDAVIPEVTDEALSQTVTSAFRPAFNILWRDSGLFSDPCFDKDGYFVG